ncbi:MAG TPA: hypothetical protein PKH97_02560 [Tetrasphaera sp.]|uniref:hypothetical protein n=1 Tax=Nostocoides sp. TaxID=1917966 RepID=UPI002CE34D09|nr:hypothetical protein [Tetrasphaera sp.]HNQ06051.1 hypothetical protein [Tetrasphaera sp.]
MWIDCQSCPVAQTHCGECVVTSLLDIIPVGRAEMQIDVDVALDARERAAVTALASAGLIGAETAATARARISRPAPVGFRSATG